MKSAQVSRPKKYMKQVSCKATTGAEGRKATKNRYKNSLQPNSLQLTRPAVPQGQTDVMKRCFSLERKCCALKDEKSLAYLIIKE